MLSPTWRIGSIPTHSVTKLVVPSDSRVPATFQPGHCSGVAMLMNRLMFDQVVSRLRKL